MTYNTEYGMHARLTSIWTLFNAPRRVIYYVSTERKVALFALLRSYLPTASFTDIYRHLPTFNCVIWVDKYSLEVNGNRCARIHSNIATTIK